MKNSKEKLKDEPGFYNGIWQHPVVPQNTELLKDLGFKPFRGGFSKEIYEYRNEHDIARTSKYILIASDYIYFCNDTIKAGKLEKDMVCLWNFDRAGEIPVPKLKNLCDLISEGSSWKKDKNEKK